MPVFEAQKDLPQLAPQNSSQFEKDRPSEIYELKSSSFDDQQSPEGLKSSSSQNSF